MKGSDSKEPPSLVGIAVAQSLTRLSIKFPAISRRMAMLLVLLVPLLPAAGSIVAIVLGQYLVGGILATLSCAIVSCALFMAGGGCGGSTAIGVHHPRTDKDLRSSLRTLQFRFGQVRAKRSDNDLYDVYLPPGTQTDAIKCALLLIPNQGVDHVAYANVAAQLSDQGILVVIQNTEPYRVPSTLVGSGLCELRAIQRDVDKDYAIAEWAIGGHGMGSIPAARLAETLQMRKVVIWGAYPSWNVDLGKSKVNVMVIIGSNDGYWTCQSVQEMNRFKSLCLPKDKSVLKLIAGGNHAGFAHYGPLPQDGEREIRVEEQQKTAATLTALFLKSSGAPGASYVPPSSDDVEEQKQQPLETAA